MTFGDETGPVTKLSLSKKQIELSQKAGFRLKGYYQLELQLYLRCEWAQVVGQQL